ncbi:hypothetical protein SETIT_2G334900v2 [Setaria italica]|uniref:Uncharacterized protein n=1 Tax=Setaria italica TaxID=4555 RepID=K4A2T9_SETIT|nr:hypothetical protein SETIT_2G334900v2 [Setaria italica]
MSTGPIRPIGLGHSRARLISPFFSVKVWRAYCNNKSCGYAVRRECGAADWRVLRALEPVSMGAGVIPASSSGGGEGDVMYMRARFERVVGSRDSEAFYMMNPDRAWLQQPSSHAGHDGLLLDWLRRS